MSEMSDTFKLVNAMELAKTARVGMELTYFDVIELMGEFESLKEYITEIERDKEALSGIKDILREHIEIGTLQLSTVTAHIAELEAEIDQLTAHDATERKDDKSPNDTQTQTFVYGKEREE